jgi:hypothetical protein
MVPVIRKYHKEVIDSSSETFQEFELNYFDEAPPQVFKNDYLPLRTIYNNQKLFFCKNVT